ncbi:MAG: Holliday junction resolvase RuvX [Acidobacteriota bacterium]|nr:Holliday junction resolvase RuvX [Acidobacteriota bacterium]
MRILAIDFGTRRLGLAVSDPSGKVALGLPTLSRKNLAEDLSRLGELISQYEPGEVLVGLPVSKGGAESAMSIRAAGFAKKLQFSTGRPVRLWDERLSSAEANRLLRSSGISIEKRKRAVDRVAATLILQNYLDWRSQALREDVAAGDPQ